MNNLAQGTGILILAEVEKIISKDGFTVTHIALDKDKKDKRYVRLEFGIEIIRGPLDGARADYRVGLLKEATKKPPEFIVKSVITQFKRDWPFFLDEYKNECRNYHG